MGALDASLSQIRATPSYVGRFVGTGIADRSLASSIRDSAQALQPLVATFTTDVTDGGTLSPAGGALDVFA